MFSDTVHMRVVRAHAGAYIILCVDIFMCLRVCVCLLLFLKKNVVNYILEMCVLLYYLLMQA